MKCTLRFVGDTNNNKVMLFVGPTAFEQLEEYVPPPKLRRKKINRSWKKSEK